MRITKSNAQLIQRRADARNAYESGEISPRNYRDEEDAISESEVVLTSEGKESDGTIAGWIAKNFPDRNGVVILSTKEAKKMRHDAFQVFARHEDMNEYFPNGNMRGVLEILVGLTNELKPLDEEDESNKFICA
jgi:hypothetical protein